MPQFKLGRPTFVEWLVMAALVGFVIPGAMQYVITVVPGTFRFWHLFICPGFLVSLVLFIGGLKWAADKMDAYFERARLSYRAQPREPDPSNQDLPPGC